VGTKAKEQVTLLTDYAADSAYSKAYYTLFANIRFNWDNEQGQQHTVLLTAPAHYPEQATIVANVAIAAALSGTPTILIDADLRTSNLHHRFGANNVPGLSNWLAEQATHKETVAQFLSKTFVPDLYLLNVGTSTLQPHEISRWLSTKLQGMIASIRQFLAETEQRTSMIIFNSPPVLAGIDASLVSSLVEQTFLLIATGQTTRAQAKQAQEQLQRAHAKLTGIIMLDM
jgi:capsular exopolysaccharide synthesis family protein